MLQPEVTKVLYPLSLPNEQPTVVERLDAGNLTRDEALGLIALYHTAYQAFENTGDFIPQEVTPYSLDKRREALQKDASHGRQMWVIRNAYAGDSIDLFDGYIQLGATGRGATKGTRLRQIHVRPPFGRGYGSRLLHAGLTLDNWPRDKQFTLNAAHGNPANHFYQKTLKLVPKISQNGSLKYSTPENATLADVIQTLEQRHPDLTKAVRLQ